MGKVKAIITQNIDGLHQLAGSKAVYELHGTIHKNYCVNCNKSYSIQDIIKYKDKKQVPRCSCGGLIKPQVVLYNEQLDNDIITNAIKVISACDTLIIAGTSLIVYPAAGLVDYFNGKNLILINKDDVTRNVTPTIIINDLVGKTLAKINLH